jgi:surface protein
MKVMGGKIFFVVAMLFFCSVPSFIFASPLTTNAFVTTWQTADNDGTAYLIFDAVCDTSCDIYWELVSDDTVNGTTTSLICNDPDNNNYCRFALPEAGEYRVDITNNLNSFSTNAGNPSGLLSVEQWGNTVWEDMNGMFQYASNFELHATDDPDISSVTDFGFMFDGASSFNTDISDWDVSNITNMEYMFNDASSFNQPLDSWNMSNVTNIHQMFGGATEFNQPLNSWDVSSVTTNNMNWLFRGASSFNQPLDNWDVSNIDRFYAVFFDAVAFNSSLDGWVTAGVYDLGSFFNGATAFNQPLSSWDVSDVTDMGSLFTNAESFNQPLDTWDVSKVTNMQTIFTGAEDFNQDISNWNMASTTNMSEMFRDAASFNQPIGSWDVSGVEYMDSVFSRATAFNQDISTWDFSSVISMYSFLDAVSLSQANQDALLHSWLTNIPNNTLYTNIGIKSFSSAGQSDRDTLIGTYNWSIEYKISVTYSPGLNATLVGTGFQVQQGNLGNSTSLVEIVPDDGCTFVKWSDDSVENPRNDEFFDENISVTAVVDCPVAEESVNNGNSTATRVRPTATSIDTLLSQVNTMLAQPIDTTDVATLQKIVVLLSQLLLLLNQLLQNPS